MKQKTGCLRNECPHYLSDRMTCEFILDYRKPFENSDTCKFVSKQKAAQMELKI